MSALTKLISPLTDFLGITSGSDAPPAPPPPPTPLQLRRKAATAAYKARKAALVGQTKTNLSSGQGSPRLGGNQTKLGGQ